jgi:anti-sigma regulatory factor (Ser/Thr protein kinase)
VSAPSEHEFASEPTSPAAARSFAKHAVAGLLAGAPPQPLCDDLELVVSELVTNAVRAGSPSIGVSVAVERGRVVVRVSDRAGGWPQERQARLDDVGGRGLPLVSALSAAWGVQLADDGKVVWAELDVPSES